MLLGRYVKNAKAPTLIQHGATDQRVPVPNAFQLYRGLQDVGVPSKLIIYKGFEASATARRNRSPAAPCSTTSSGSINTSSAGRRPRRRRTRDVSRTKILNG